MATTNPYSFGGNTLATWRASAAVLTLTNQGNDTFTLTIPYDRADSFSFSTWNSYSLSRTFFVEGSGYLVVTYFTGYLVLPETQISPDGEFITYKFVGTWELLKRDPYEQLWMLYDEAGLVLAPQLIGRLILNQALDPLTGEVSKIDIKDQLIDALDQSAFAGNYDVGPVPTGLLPPWSDLTDRTIAEVIQAQLRWCPHIAVRVNYTAGLQFVNTSTATTHYISADTPANGSTITIYNVTPRADLLVGTFRLRWILQLEGGLLWLAREDISEADGPGTMQQTIYLSPEEPLPTAPETQALCEAAHQAFAELFHQATIDLQGIECDHNYEIGERVQFAGVASSGSTGVIQTIVHDLMAGKTTLQLGAASHLGLNDLLALVDQQRRRKQPDGSRSSGRTGPDPNPNYAPWTLVPCDSDGEEQTPGTSAATHVRLVAGGVNSFSTTALGFASGDNPPEVLELSDGDHVWVTATRFSGTGTEVSAVHWGSGSLSEMPQDSDSETVQEIGNVSFSSGQVQSIHQEISGHLSVSFCRDWFEYPTSYTGQWSAS